MTGPLNRLTAECLTVLGLSPERTDRLFWFGSGTAALAASLRAAQRLHGSRKAKKVLLPALVCPQVYVAALAAGLDPVFVASDPMTGAYGLDMVALESVPANEAVALVWVHQYGCISQFRELPALCRQKQWVLIEDAALSFGAVVEGKAAGTLGDCGIFSFGTGKVVEANYGGAVVLNDGSYKEHLMFLLKEEHDAINRIVTVDDDPMPALDREFKRVYNTHYEQFRNGLFAAELHPLLARCAQALAPLDTRRLTDRLTHNMLADAHLAVRTRNSRAAWWIERLEKFGEPIVRVLTHGNGTYWRLNVLVKPSIRHSILREGLAAGLPISSWYPPLYWLVPHPTVLGDTAKEVAFADRVLNLWVEGQADWQRYADTIEALLARGRMAVGV